MLSKYSQSWDGRWTKDDFLNYYRDLSINDSKRVWRDLIAMVKEEFLPFLFVVQIDEI